MVLILNFKLRQSYLTCEHTIRMENHKCPINFNKDRKITNEQHVAEQLNCRQMLSVVKNISIEKQIHNRYGVIVWKQTSSNVRERHSHLALVIKSKITQI